MAHPKIHVYASTPQAFFVNSFIVETENSVVLIDTQFLVSAARSLNAALTAIGKPLAGIIITHPHPDHYNGLPQILSVHPAARICATKATGEGMLATQAVKRATWTPVYGSDYPLQDGSPNEIVEPGCTIRMAGLDFVIDELGPGESSTNCVVHIPEARVLIASDLIYNDCHPWLAEERTDLWLQQLAAVEKRYSKVPVVYAGHGAQGDAQLFRKQRHYIEDFRQIVASHQKDGMLDDQHLGEVLNLTRKGRESWPLDGLIEINAKAVARESAERSARLKCKAIPSDNDLRGFQENDAAFRSIRTNRHDGLAP